MTSERRSNRAIGRQGRVASRIVVVIGLMAGYAAAGRPQLASQSSVQSGIGGQHQPTNGMPGSANPEMDMPQTPFRDSARQRMNTERQKKLVTDTQRLLALANQLKAEAAVAGTESLTPEMMHQMDEVEKLARSVKDKMRS